MMKNIKNQKGFTLIELMAVIVILAVLVMVAIPAVTTYLDSARKGAFSNSAKSAISAVRNDVIINGFNGNGSNEAIYDLTKINSLLDKTIVNSPFGGTFNNDSVKVKVTNDNGVYTYEMCMVDASNNGFSKYTKEADITSDTVKSPVTVEATDDCINLG